MYRLYCMKSCVFERLFDVLRVGAHFPGVSPCFAATSWASNSVIAAVQQMTMCSRTVKPVQPESNMMKRLLTS